MIGAQYVHDHVMHFYHLHALDWVDVVSALSADPKATASWRKPEQLAQRPRPGYFADVQKRSSRTFVEAASSASSPTATGGIRPTSCRRRPT
jgi:hydrogenase large subunit